MRTFLRHNSGMDHVDVDGMRIAYQRAGSGPVLVMLHGAPTDSRTWRWMLPDLARDRPPDDAELLEPAQALREQARGHPRHAAVQVVEAPAAAQQLAHDERRPPLAEHLGASASPEPKKSAGNEGLERGPPFWLGHERKCPQHVCEILCIETVGAGAPGMDFGACRIVVGGSPGEGSDQSEAVAATRQERNR